MRKTTKIKKIKNRGKRGGGLYAVEQFKGAGAQPYFFRLAHRNRQTILTSEGYKTSQARNKSARALAAAMRRGVPTSVIEAPAVVQAKADAAADRENLDAAVEAKQPAATPTPPPAKPVVLPLALEDELDDVFDIGEPHPATAPEPPVVVPAGAATASDDTDEFPT